MASIQLPPFPRPLGIFQAFMAQEPEAIVLKEKLFSLSGDSFSVKTLDERPLFQVSGEAFSLSGRKHVLDMQGQLLFDIRKEHFSIPATYYAERPDGQRLFEVKSKISLTSSKQICTFTNPATGKQEEIMTKGNFFDTYADITEESTGAPIARIDRQFFNARQILGGQQSYLVFIASQVDLSLIAALCICLDEKRNERSGS